jgi:hypothetical protein
VSLGDYAQALVAEQQRTDRLLELVDRQRQASGLRGGTGRPCEADRRGPAGDEASGLTASGLTASGLTASGIRASGIAERQAGRGVAEQHVGREILAQHPQVAATRRQCGIAGDATGLDLALEREQLGVGLLEVAVELAEPDPDPIALEHAAQHVHELARAALRAAVELAKAVGPRQVHVPEERERPVGVGQRRLREPGHERTIARNPVEHRPGVAAKAPMVRELHEPRVIGALPRAPGPEARHHQPHAAGHERATDEILAAELPAAPEAHRALAAALVLVGRPACAWRALAVTQAEEHGRAIGAGEAHEVIGIGDALGSGVDERIGVELATLEPLARGLEARAHERIVADGGGRGAIVHRIEDRPPLGRWRGVLLPAQELVHVGLVAGVVGEREPADVAVGGLDLLDRERDLVEIAEHELIARQLDVGVALRAKHLLLPHRGLGLGHRGRHPVDRRRLAALLLATVPDERLDEREQAIAARALGGDDPPALEREIVGVTTLVPQVSGHGLLDLPHAYRIAAHAFDHGLVIVGMDHQQAQVAHAVSGAHWVSLHVVVWMHAARRSAAMPPQASAFASASLRACRTIANAAPSVAQW